MAEPIVVITDTPAWADAASAVLVERGFSPVRFESRNNYVTRLVDMLAAMVLVDGERDGWQFWTATPKSSPATRRIPIVLVTNDADARHKALTSGADIALSSAELLAQLPTLLADYARVFGAADELDCQCDEPLPPTALAGVEQFNAGEFYKQHDLFEALWMQETGPVRDLYRAILQVGVAYHQIIRSNHRGALKMLLRSVQWLLILPDVCQGVDVKQLREDAARVRAELEHIDPAEIGAFDRTLLKPVKLVQQERNS